MTKIKSEVLQLITNYYTLGAKLIVFVEGDVYCMTVVNSVQDLLHGTFKGVGFKEVVVINENKRSRAFIR